MKKILSLLFLFLIIPFVYSANYGRNKYGCGIYGIGCEEVAKVEESPGSLGLPTGARGGGCDFFADKYKICYHIDSETSECKEGCLEGYYCDDEDYRCKLGKLVTKTVIETILEIQGKKAVIISLSIISIILLGFLIEIKKLKREKSTERGIKETSPSIYEKEVKK